MTRVLPVPQAIWITRAPFVHASRQALLGLILDTPNYSLITVPIYRTCTAWHAGIINSMSGLLAQPQRQRAHVAFGPSGRFSSEVGNQALDFCPADGSVLCTELVEPPFRLLWQLGAPACEQQVVLSLKESSSFLFMDGTHGLQRLLEPQQVTCRMKREWAKQGKST